MRSIGHLADEAQARAFGDYLYSQDIENTVEPEDGVWMIWVHAEDRLDSARERLEEFRRNPNDRCYAKAARVARQKRDQAEEEREAAAKRYFDRTTIFPDRVLRLGRVTAVLLGLSIFCTLITGFGQNDLFRTFFGLVWFDQTPLSWRLLNWFTRIFVHGDFLHLFFNLWWLKDLGSLIEARRGRATLIGLVLLTSAPPNLAEAFLTGSGAIGISGVVYGLLGYVWIHSRYAPETGLVIDPFSMAIMMAWYFLCLMGVIHHIANVTHTAGLAIGLLAGAVAVLRHRR